MAVNEHKAENIIIKTTQHIKIIKYIITMYELYISQIIQEMFINGFLFNIIKVNLCITFKGIKIEIIE